MAFVMMCGMRSWVTKVPLPCLVGVEAGEPSWRVLAPAPGTPAGNRARCSPALAAAGEVGGLAARLVGVEEKSACHSGICEVSADRFSRKDRAVMLGLAGRLDLVAASGSAPVLAALQHAHAWQGARRDHVSSATRGKWATVMSSAPERPTRYSNGGT